MTLKPSPGITGVVDLQVCWFHWQALVIGLGPLIKFQLDQILQQSQVSKSRLSESKVQCKIRVIGVGRPAL